MIGCSSAKWRKFVILHDGITLGSIEENPNQIIQCLSCKNINEDLFYW